MYFVATVVKNGQPLNGQTLKRQNNHEIDIIAIGGNLTGQTLTFLAKAKPDDPDDDAVLTYVSSPVAATPTGGDFPMTLTDNRATGQIAISPDATKNLQAGLKLHYAFQWKNTGGTSVDEVESGSFTIGGDLIRN